MNFIERNKEDLLLIIGLAIITEFIAAVVHVPPLVGGAAGSIAAVIVIVLKRVSEAEAMRQQVWNEAQRQEQDNDNDIE